MRSVLLLLGLGACLALLLASCFNPKLDDTPFQCGPGGACPPDYECQSGFCRRPGAGPDAPPARIDARIDRDAPSCDPDQFLRCKDATTAVFCLPDGQGEIEQGCAFACDESHGLCLQCNPGVPTICQGDTLHRCSTVGELTSTDCAGWCEGQGSVASCVTLAPSNLPADTCAATPERSFRTGGDVLIDTDVCTAGIIVPQPSPGLFSPPSICVLIYKDFRIDQGGRVTGAGQNALAIVATGSFRVDGTIDVSAAREAPGAGASRGGLGSGMDASDVTIGGGGAGFGLVGPDATQGSAGPGSAYGRPELSPLFGGSHGGRGGVPICVMCGGPSPGGGGGGAVQLVACNTLEVGNDAQVLASGGGGTGGESPFQLGVGSGGGGGGSGGGILIEAEIITVGNNVVAAANGGGGGGGGQVGGGEDGQPGEDGRPSSSPASGGPAQLNAGDGGNGGTRGDVSSSGQLALPGTAGKSGFGSGGSGGSAGRIRVNVRAGAPLPLPNNAIVSPAPSVGQVGRHVIP